MGLTTDPKDPRLTHYTGPEAPGPQADVYLVLSDEELAKGYVRPVRHAYVHDVGERACGVETRMGDLLSKTYARNPRFYGATYCVGCQAHFPVGPHGEFHWVGTDDLVGT